MYYYTVCTYMYIHMYVKCTMYIFIYMYMYVVLLSVSFLCMGQPRDSKQERYREQLRQMLNEMNKPNSSRHPDSSVVDSEPTGSSSTASLPEIHEKEEEEDVREQGKERRTEERQKEREGESGNKSQVSERKITSSADEISTRRRVGVVDRPQVVVVGGSEDLSRPRSASSHEVSTRERPSSEKSLGRARTDIDVPRSVQRKKQPVKKLEIKPVQTKPSAAAQRLVEEKRERRGLPAVEEGEGGGDKTVEEDGGNGGGEEMQNGGTNGEEQTNKMEVQCVYTCIHVNVCANVHVYVHVEAQHMYK